MADQCPISSESVGERASRGVAGSVLLLAVALLILPSVIIAGLLAVDFGLRAFGAGRFSPLGAFAKALVRLLRITERAVNAAPKRFAARLGFAMSLAIAASAGFGAPAAARLIAGILGTCAALESFAGVCIGCMIYSRLAGLTSRKAPREA